MIDIIFTIFFYFFVFALIHSLLVANRTKFIVKNMIGEFAMRKYYRLFFTIISFASLLFISYKIYELPDYEIISLPFPLKVVFIGFQICGFSLLLYAGKNFDFLEFVGIKQLKRQVNDDTDIEGLTKTGLITSGAYGIVRHPMYLAGILIFTFNPEVTVKGLTISILANMYLIFGAWIESKRYVKLYGDEYISYSQRVPMIIPRFSL
ncbi:MAG: hypothetical protein N2738_08535 [Thermodesulfovibrionales bacterium]|nr:hypothetical protein [Thermodesulfovibrionales bacterium]